MAYENGVWVMYGPDWNSSDCLHTVEEAIQYIDQVGFLPLFKNTISGFSLEEKTAPEVWWCEDPERDPWIWREQIARSGRIMYGKFFDKKAGFISRKWLPVFANYRRDGYDFDALWDDELASLRQKKIMDCFSDGKEEAEYYSFELKKLAGFGSGGEKGFEGIVTKLQTQTYLCIRDFRCRQNKRGQEYGWPIAVYCRPEHLWGYEYVTSAYTEDPEESGRQIEMFLRDRYPGLTKTQMKGILGR